MAKPAKGKKKVDVALLQGPTEDGKGARIIRYQDGTLSAGEVRPVEEGKALGEGELVKLKPTAENSPVCEVEVLHDGAAKPAEARKQGHGPARVSNDVYRKNWNQVFGRSSKAKAASEDKPRKARKATDYSLN